MTSELESLKTCYETLGMTPEEIAEDRALEVTAVKAGLVQCSSKYRRDSGGIELDKKALDFDDNDVLLSKNTIREIALGSDDEGLRLKAAIYMRDDYKGRLDVKKALQGSGFNILQFNNFMQVARAKSEEIKSSVMGNAINV